jgi:hypothetical protein
MNKIPPEYRPIVYIAFAFILFTLFYFIFSPYQQCKRAVMDAGKNNFSAVYICGDRHTW